MTRDVAILFAIVVGAFITSLTVSLAFVRPTYRYLSCLWRDEVGTYADRLCSGIWTSAIGCALTAMSVMVRLATGQRVIWLVVVSWALIALGYYLHFTAWRTTMIGRQDGFSCIWAAVVIGICVAAGFTFLIVLND